jgi:hypothetical protein
MPSFVLEASLVMKLTSLLSSPSPSLLATSLVKLSSLLASLMASLTATPLLTPRTFSSEASSFRGALPNTILWYC